METWSVVMLDQRLLPNREVYRLYRDSADVIRAIKVSSSAARPAIGVAAAMGLRSARERPPTGSPP